MKSRFALLITAGFLLTAASFSLRDHGAPGPAPSAAAPGFTGMLNSIVQRYDPAPMHYAGVGGMIWLAIAVLRRKPNPRRHSRTALPRATRTVRPDPDTEQFFPTINPS